MVVEEDGTSGYRVVLRRWSGISIAGASDGDPGWDTLNDML